ncbi:putative membrane protein [Pseudomonas aeruginosa]|nr:putative membrane protein [Pseudomonas aeruginosa]
MEPVGRAVRGVAQAPLLGQRGGPPGDRSERQPYLSLGVRAWLPYPPGERPAGPLRLGAGGRAAVIKNLWFVLAAFCEIAGCYAFYLWLRLGKSALWVLPGLLSLTLFALLLTRVEASYAGRAYAAYGGIYVAASLFWLAFVERSRPLWSDWLGVALCVVGASVVLFGPGLSQ